MQEKSVIDQIIEEEHFERECSIRTSKRSQNFRLLLRKRKVQEMIKNIKRNLDASIPYPIDRGRKYIENYTDYPEVRPYASQVLAKLSDAKPISSKRRVTCMHLQRLIQSENQNG